MNDPEILGFLETYPELIQKISLNLMNQVREVVPDVQEQYYKGWKLIGYSALQGKKDFYFSFVAPYQDHVDLGFEYGTMMNDHLGVLSGTGKQIKTIKCFKMEDTERPFLKDYILEALETARMIRFGKED
ncbi:MAG: hypothetical protein KDK36_08950 [Leptospiraceae bacterium]|nr:hypothetical protein [Leptospiraceae bacterium]